MSQCKQIANNNNNTLTDTSNMRESPETIDRIQEFITLNLQSPPVRKTAVDKLFEKMKSRHNQISKPSTSLIVVPSDNVIQNLPDQSKRLPVKPSLLKYLKPKNKHKNLPAMVPSQSPKKEKVALPKKLTRAQLRNIMERSVKKQHDKQVSIGETENCNGAATKTPSPRKMKTRTKILKEIPVEDTKTNVSVDSKKGSKKIPVQEAVKLKRKLSKRRKRTKVTPKRSPRNKAKVADEAESVSPQLNVEEIESASPAVAQTELDEEVALFTELTKDTAKVPEATTEIKADKVESGKFLTPPPDVDQEQYFDYDSDSQSKAEWCPEDYAEYKMNYSAKKLSSIKPIFTCKVCLLVFSSYYRLNKHKERHTKQSNPYTCPHCNEELGSVVEFTAHIRVHKGKNPYTCQKCNKGFWTKTALEAHTPIHILRKPKEGVKKFRCDVCAKEFTKLCDMERHTRVHTGEKPCVCNICNKRFQQSHNLSKHLLTHLHVKPFHCDICNKQFGRNDVLNRHLLTHSVDKPFKCTKCPKGFIRQSQLDQHAKKHHSSIQAD